ncbi:histidine phosphatase family protein [Micromonospora sp. H61]|uniref:histidine phosphatase family protein n=1 Tax=Micromonospora sp. H61 TaxID=2824888 RepID=UPI001B391618|nr:histidine phosphatase family protein [Micromonospora sp. H61]MBQ0990698.1 histidine phosphatase family protein [Micromonospora sp. H61]
MNKRRLWQARSIDAIYTSPTLRCRQTMEPLSAKSGLSLSERPELYEPASFGETSEWAPGCTHRWVKRSVVLGLLVEHWAQ